MLSGTSSIYLLRFVFNSSWQCVVVVARPKETIQALGIGAEFCMGEKFPGCDGWNLVGSSRGTSWNLGTRAKHCLWDWPLPFSKAWHASQHSVPTPKDLFLSPGCDWFLLVPHVVVPSSWHLNCVPTGRCCLVTRASWLLLRKLLRAKRGGTSFQWLLRGVCPFCTGLGMKGGGVALFL